MNNKPWYVKHWPIATAAAFSVAFFASLLAVSSSAPVTSTQIVQVQQQAAVVQTAPVVQHVQAPTPAPADTTNALSNDNHYVNSAGNTVHSPAYSNSAPQGASAQCRDGTYSFSQSRRGTCSHHGGVASWL